MEDDVLRAAQQQQDDELAALVSAQPLISDFENFSGLTAQLAGNANFSRKVEGLATSYLGLHKVRGDGSCFYRSYLFAAIQLATHDAAALTVLTDRVGASRDRLLAGGFPDYCVDDAYECFSEFLAWVAATRPSAADIRDKLSTDGLDQYVIMYSRFLVSYHLQTRSEELAPFLDDGLTMGAYIQRFVEPMTAEAEHLACLALVEELGVSCRIVQLTQGEAGPATWLDLGSSPPAVHLLFRPGHYDVLVRKPDVV